MRKIENLCCFTANSIAGNEKRPEESHRAPEDRGCRQEDNESYVDKIKQKNCLLTFDRRREIEGYAFSMPWSSRKA